MTTINEELNQISIIRLLIVGIVTIFAMVIIEDLFLIEVPYDLLWIVLTVYIAYKLKGCSLDFHNKLSDAFKTSNIKLITWIVILNLIFSYGMIYLSILFIGTSFDLSNSIAHASGLFAVGTAISTIIIAPVSEELVFRGVIFNRLNKRINVILAILISSILFGLCHDYGGMFSAFIFGICMCILYIKTDNIFVPMGAHFLNNLISEILDFIDPAGDFFYDPTIICIILVLAFIVFIVLMYYIVKELKAINKNNN
ncbi:MAG: type II CAAX endopeptidase family protein [Methanobrevibacter sp.]|uniref:CPBP family intramembrane glutamic endopeptidase n=1 Tax=Methanobrevibacter sp. TaxID=66852 RepID=UPI0026DF5893|nr:type II CAAX endopeptidase family protein [Methanobrevibacter sp.]MDO5847998.1 type II CAAX endopeptidase family protein [Methanobrevibacter sp.]